MSRSSVDGSHPERVSAQFESYHLIKKAGVLLLIVALVLPVLYIVSTAVYSIVVHHVSIIVQDQLVIYPSLLADPFWEAVLSQRNGHRIILPAAVAIADLRFMDASNRLLVGTTLICLLHIGIVMIMRIRCSNDLYAKTPLCAIVIALLFWFGQNRVLGVPFSGAIVCIAGAFMISSFVCFDDASRPVRTRWPLLVVAMLCGLGASTSFGVGMAVWPALLMLCYRNRCHAGVWSLLGLSILISVVIYFQLPGGENVRGSLGVDLAMSAKFLMSFVGGVPIYALSGFEGFELDSVGSMSIPVGLAALIAGGFLIMRWLFKQDAPDPIENLGAALIVFSVAVASLITLGRSNWDAFDVELLAPRYLIWSTFYWIGFLIMIGGMSADSVRRRPMMGILFSIGVVIVCWSLLPSHYSGLVMTWTHNEAARKNVLSLEMGMPNTKDILLLATSRSKHHPRVKGLIELTPLLRLGELNYYRDHKYKLFGEAASQYFDLETARRCKGGVSWVGAVHQSELWPGPGERPPGEGTDEIAAFRVTGQVPLDTPRGSFLIYVDSDGTVVGLGAIETTGGFLLLRSDPLRAHGYVDGRAEGRVLVPYIARRALSREVCRLRPFVAVSPRSEESL